MSSEMFTLLSILLAIVLAINGVHCINANSTHVFGQRMIQPNITFKKWCESVKTQCYFDRKSRALCHAENSSQCGPCGFPAGKIVTFSSIKSDLTCHNPSATWVYHNQPGGIIPFSFLGDINQYEQRLTMCMRPNHNKLSLSDFLQSACVGSDCSKQSVNFRVCVLDSPHQEITPGCFSKHTQLGFPGNRGTVHIYIEGTLSCEHCIIEASINELAIGCFPVVIKPSSSQPKRIKRHSIDSANETTPEVLKTNTTNESKAAPIVSVTDSKVLKTDEVNSVTDPKVLKTDEVVSVPDSKVLKTDEAISVTDPQVLKTDEGISVTDSKVLTTNEGISVTDSKVLNNNEVVSVTDSKRLETHGVNQTPDLLPKDASKQPNTSSYSHQSTGSPRDTPVNLFIPTKVLKLNVSDDHVGTTVSLKSSVSFNESISTNGNAVTEDIVDNRMVSNNNKVIHHDTDQNKSSKHDKSEPLVRTSLAKVDNNISKDAKSDDNIFKALPENKKSTSELVQQGPGNTTVSYVSSVRTMSFEEEWNMHEKEAEKHEMDIQANLAYSSYGTTEPDPAPEPDPFLALNDMTDPPVKSPAQSPDVIMMWSYSVLSVLVAFSTK